MTNSDPGGGGQDIVKAGLTALAFGLALSGTGLVYPLLALDVGMSASAVGAFTMVSAFAQLLTRLLLPWLLSRVHDRTLMTIAFICMGASAAVLLVFTTAAAFVAAQALQGSGRALFWTSNQTHAARAPGQPVRRLAQVQVAGHTGTLAGPVIAGLIAIASLYLALWLVAAACVVGASTAMTLIRRPRYRRDGRQARRGVWRRQGVRLGCWTSFLAGGWRGMLESFVPVVLATAGLSAAAIGWLVAVAEGASMAGTVWLARWGRSHLAPVVRLCALGALAGAAALPLVADNVVLAAAALAIAGAGGGLSSALGPAIANGDVEQADQGTAIALAGTYRAASRLAGPSVLAAAGSTLGVPLAMVLATVGMVAPVLSLSRRSRQ